MYVLSVYGTTVLQLSAKETTLGMNEKLASGHNTFKRLQQEVGL